MVTSLLVVMLVTIFGAAWIIFTTLTPAPYDDISNIFVFGIVGIAWLSHLIGSVTDLLSSAVENPLNIIIFIAIVLLAVFAAKKGRALVKISPKIIVKRKE